jgi:predicted SAM-dependent methyltransferase
MTSGNLKLHLGCELNTPDGWINLDGSWGAWLAKYPRLRAVLKLTKIFPRHLVEKPWPRDILVHDLNKPLPFPDNSLAAIYAAHVLEHLYLTEAQRLLAECYRTLEPGGVIRLVVPDLHAYIAEYIAAEPGTTPSGAENRINRADLFQQRLMLREAAPASGRMIYKLYSKLTDFHSHKWMYDVESLTYYLAAAGLSHIHEMPPHESLIADIATVEQVEKIAGGAGICLEGVKLH